MGKYKLLAFNVTTHQEVVLGIFEEMDEGWEAMQRIEFDEDDIIEDWFFQMVAVTDEGYDCEPDDIDSDFGFDPYEGCFTYDC